MKEQLYTELKSEIHALITGVRNPISNYANVCAAIFDKLPDINWVGFYFLYENKLSLGPFQGKPACVSIPLGKGVCGTAMQDGKTLLVKDVHQYPGHIACDAASKSEIVIPLIKNGVKIGVLDIDSPIISRFDKEDQKHLEKIAELVLKNL